MPATCSATHTFTIRAFFPGRSFSATTASARVPANVMDQLKTLNVQLSELTDEQAVIFIATGLEAGRACPDDTEVLAHRRVHFADVLEAVLDGTVREAVTVAAILCAQHMAISGALPAGVTHAILNRLGDASA